MGISLDSIQGDIHNISITDSTGANALAVDASGHISINDGGNSITIDNADLGTIAGAVSGSEMQVDIVAALPAGTNNIGDVDVLTMPGTQIEDAASAGGETLMMVGGYRQDANTSPVTADGDFHGFIFNALGELKTSTRLDDVADSSVVVTTVTIDTTVGGVQLVASALTSRRDLTVQNLGNSDIWIKAGTGVTAGAGGNGFKLPKGSSMEKKWGASIDLYGIAASGTASVKVVEAA